MVDELVHLPALIDKALPTIDRSRARMMICHGSVYVNGECVGLPDMDYPRSGLANGVIRVGTRVLLIDETATHIRRRKRGEAIGQQRLVV